MDTYVYLECIKVKSKLRVRIVSNGYYNDANCMFPKDIRKEGRKYRVSRECVNLITTRGKSYYSVRSGYIEVLPEILEPSQIKIFEDTTSDECCICMCNPKNVIINPCGHYYMCRQCTTGLKKCPICRCDIGGFMTKSQMGLI